MGFVSDKSQEENHAKLWDETKLQLKQPNLRWINLQCMSFSCQD